MVRLSSRCRGFDTREEAQAYRDQVERELERQDLQYRAAKLIAEAEAAFKEARAVEGKRKTVRDAIDAYELYLLAVGTSPATHRNDLKEARRLWRWLMKQNWAAANPWASVEPIGRIPKGKEQLRDHEAETLERVALARARGEGIGSDHWAENRKLGGLAVLVALYLGPRPKEVVTLTVRDVGPTVLYVDGTKSDNAQRRVRIPEVLGELLVEHASTCSARGQERLFPFTRDWLRGWTQRLCKAAGVPARVRTVQDQLTESKTGRENGNFLDPLSVPNTPSMEKPE